MDTGWLQHEAQKSFSILRNTTFIMMVFAMWLLCSSLSTRGQALSNYVRLPVGTRFHRAHFSFEFSSQNSLSINTLRFSCVYGRAAKESS